MTAITDILVNSNLGDLQLSNSNQKSQISSTNTSFQDYLASFKTDENKSVSNENYSKKDDYSKTEERISEKKSSDSDEKIHTEEKSEKSSENIQTENKTEKTEFVEEKNNSADETTEKSEEKSVKSNLVKAEKNKSEVKVDSKKENNQIDIEKLLQGKNVKNETEKTEEKSAQKKSLKNDFSRLDELLKDSKLNIEEDLTAENELAEIQVAENLKTKGTVLKEKDEIKGTVLTDSEIKLDSSESFFEFDPENILAKNSSVNTDFENGNPRISKLDKDGKITVEDFRTEIPVEKKNLETDKTELKTQVKYDGDNSATITMEIAQNADVDVRSLNSQTAASDGSNFQAMLNNTIQNNASEFVKAGNIILKDNDKGTINLVLRPDELGNVKIHLSMDGKTVSGHITVNSKEALQVFKDNAETLREAFIKNGFDAANFDVAYNNNSSGQNQEFNQQFNDSQFVGKRTYSEMGIGDAAVDGNIFEESDDFSKYSVNIVA